MPKITRMQCQHKKNFSYQVQRTRWFPLPQSPRHRSCLPYFQMFTNKQSAVHQSALGLRGRRTRTTTSQIVEQLGKDTTRISSVTLLLPRCLVWDSSFRARSLVWVDQRREYSYFSRKAGNSYTSAWEGIAAIFFLFVFLFFFWFFLLSYLLHFYVWFDLSQFLFLFRVSLHNSCHSSEQLNHFRHFDSRMWWAWGRWEIEVLKTKGVIEAAEVSSLRFLFSVKPFPERSSTTMEIDDVEALLDASLQKSKQVCIAGDVGTLFSLSRNECIGIGRMRKGFVRRAVS